MKKFILAFLVLATTVVNAAEVTVLEAGLPSQRRGQTNVDTRFYIDTDSKEGYVKVAVSEDEITYETRYEYCGYDRGPWGPRRPGPGHYCYRQIPIRVSISLLKETVRVEGLVLEDKKVIYQGAEGDVVCGTMGVSRILKVPTLYLSGKCQLESRVVSQGFGRKVVVTLKTK